MAASKKDLKSGGLSSLLRNESMRAKAKAAAEVRAGQGNAIEINALGRQVRIFDVLTFIEASWGLGMSLYPAQKFIVKLYYNIPLDDTTPTIDIKDWATQQTKLTLTEKQYLVYLYEQGRCNIKEQDHMRRQLLLSIGRRAGKCISGDSLVLTDRGIFPIERLGKAALEGFSPLSVRVAQAAGREAMSTHFYDGGVKPVISIRTDAGFAVRGTDNHRVLVLDSTGEVGWKYLADIAVGDFLALNRKTNLWASDPVGLRQFHRRGGYPDTLDERLGNLLGYLVGDGVWNETQGVHLTAKHDETRKHLNQLLTSFFGDVRGQPDNRTESTGRVGVYSVLARRFLHDLGWSLEVRRGEKRIPWSILRSPRAVVCSFLRGLFETEGCAGGGGRNITFSSESFELAREVQVLLLNLGIVAKVCRGWDLRTKRFYANLTLKGVRSRRRFAECIGFDSQKKQTLLLAALTSAQEGKSDTESVPYQQSWAKALLESVPKKAAGLEWGKDPVREALDAVLKPSCGEDLTYSRIEKAVTEAKARGAFGPALTHFERLLDEDFFFDPVSSVEQGVEHVYDLTVPDGAAFVANGLVNHNTTLSAIFAAYELYRILSLYSPQEYYGLPPGNRIQILSIATGKDQAQILFNDVTAHISKCEWFQPYIASNTLGYVQFRTPYDIDKYGPTVRDHTGKFQSLNGKASVRLTFKPAISTSLRGAGNIVIIMDEMAHFQTEGKSSAKDIYDAVVPSALAFSPKDPNDKMKPVGPVESRIIGISSPLNKAGKFYELYHFAMSRAEGSNNLIAIQAPTWEVNPTVEPEFLRQKYHEDPAVFMTEYGAEFSDRVRGWIERERDLTECIDLDRRPKNFGPPRHPHQMGIDVGLIGDGTAIAITHVENDCIVLDYHETWTAGMSWRVSNPHLDSPITDYAKTLETVERLDFEEISKWIIALNRRFHITDGIFDRWNGIPLEQALVKAGLKQFKSEFFTREARSRMYQAVKLLFFDRKISLYDWPRGKPAEGGKRFSPLIEEFLALQAEQTSHNQILVAAPKIAGAHDDTADAVVRAIWMSLERLQVQKHAARGFFDRGQPQAGRQTSSSTQYQMRRMKSHGTHTERMSPRSPFLRGR